MGYGNRFWSSRIPKSTKEEGKTMRDKRRLDRRDFLRLTAGVATGAIAAACAPTTPVVVEKEVIKEVAVEKVVKETVVVEKVVEKKVAAPPEMIHLRYGTHSFGEQLPGFLMMMEKFNEEHDKIYVAVEAKPWGAYWQALETQCVAGIAPDVCWSEGFSHPEFIEGGCLLDVTSYIDEEGIDLNDWFGGKEQAYWRGKYYGMPFGVGVVIFFYNKTLFDADGVDYPDETWNWNDWREAATALTKDTNGDGRVDQFGMHMSAYEEVCWYPLILTNGGQWCNGMHFANGGGYWDLPAEPIKWTLGDDPAAVEALKWWQDNICELGIHPRSGEVTLAAGVGDEFAAGIAATSMAGTWRFNRYKNITAFEWDVAPIPKSPNTGKRMTTHNIMPNWVTTSTKYPDAAWELAKWCAMDYAQRILGENKIKFPMLKTAADSYMNPPPDNLAIVPEALEYGWSYASEAYPGNKEVFAVLGSELQYAYICEKPAEQAAKDATEAVNEVLVRINERLGL